MTTPARPQVLTTTCAYLGGVFAIQFVKVLALAIAVGTPDGQDDASRQIGWFRVDGASFADAVSIYRIVLTVIAVLAAAGVVFAVYVARGDHTSRILVTVVAGVLFVVGLAGLTGNDFFGVALGFLAALFAAQLWTPVVRSHFRVLAGKAPLVAPVKASAPVSSLVDARSSAAGDSTPVHPVYPTQGGSPYAPPPVHATRPRSVSIVAWTAFAGSAVVGVVSALALLALLVLGSDEYERAIRDSPVSSSMLGSDVDYAALYDTSLVLLGIYLVVSIGGFVASLLLLAGRRSAQVVMFVAAVVTIVVSVLGFPVGLPWTAAAIVAIVQLRKPESRAWFART